MSYKEIAGLIPTTQSLALVGKNLKDLKKKPKNLIKSGVRNIVGINLIKSSANAVKLL